MDPLSYAKLYAVTAFPQNLTLVLIMAIYCGILIPVFIAAMIIFWSRGFKTVAAKATAAVTVICFCLAMLQLAATIVGTVVGLHTIAFGATNFKAVHAAGTIANFRSNIALQWAQEFIVDLNNAVLIWRTSVLYAGNIWVTGSLCLLWLASAGTGITTTSLFTIFGLNPSSSIRHVGGRLTVTSGYSTVALSVVATAFILYRLWNHRILIRSGLNRDNAQGKSPAQRVLALLGETGLIYSVLQLATSLTNQLEGNVKNPSFASVVICNIIIYSTWIGSGVYPAIIVILVHSQRSVTESYKLTTRRDLATGELHSSERDDADLQTPHDNMTIPA